MEVKLCGYTVRVGNWKYSMLNPQDDDGWMEGWMEECVVCVCRNNILMTLGILMKQSLFTTRKQK